MVDPAVILEARRTTRRVARTFALACRLLPPGVRDDVYLLYLVFRDLDDAVDDGHEDAHETIAAVEAWCAGGPPVGRQATLLQDVSSRRTIPRDAMADFCAGMRDDLAGRPIETEEDLDRYCYRVAGTVGLVMAHVLGVDDPDRALPAATTLGMAMQRTNVLRDIDEDGELGRVYVPRQSVTRHGSLLPGSREALMRDQIARADALYEAAIPGIAHLRSGRRAIAAAAAMYREILRQIERDGHGARPGRAVVPPARRAVVGARAALRAPRPARPGTPALAAAPARPVPSEPADPPGQGQAPPSRTTSAHLAASPQPDHAPMSHQ